MIKNKYIILPSLLVIGITLLLWLGCGGGIKGTESTGSSVTYLKASEVLASIPTADWTAAAADPHIITFVENGGTYSYSSNKPMVFERGRPYVMRLVNPSSNLSKHYFTATEFFKAIVTRKLQTPDAEYKFPYLEAVELLTGATDRQVEIYFVPIVPGTYGAICTIDNHADLGMNLSMQITGAGNVAIDFEVPSTFNTALTTDARKSSTHSVWASTQTQTITVDDYSFTPQNPSFTKDVGYRVTLNKQNISVGAHYWSSPTFFRTLVWRKLMDTHAEVKPYYLSAVELRTSGTATTDLYFVPTVSGSYGVTCTIDGHVDLGMTGTIAVP